MRGPVQAAPSRRLLFALRWRAMEDTTQKRVPDSRLRAAAGGNKVADMTGRTPVRVVLDVEQAAGTISGDIAVGDASRAL